MRRRMFSLQVFVVYALLILSMALPLLVFNVSTSTNLVQDVHPDTGIIVVSNTSSDSGALAPTFSNAFFFSHQTISSIGYGALSPRSDWSNFFVALFGFFGFILISMSSGLIWSKFTKTNGALVAFSEKAIITRFHGKRALMIRIAGLWRYKPITTARVRAMAYLPWYDKRTGEQRGIRGHNLKFLRDFSPFFILPTTFIHIIDEDSPLHSLTSADFSSNAKIDKAISMWFTVVFEGLDTCLGQTVLIEHSYPHEQIKWGYQHSDMLNFDGNRINVNMLNLHETKPLEIELGSNEEKHIVEEESSDENTIAAGKFLEVEQSV